MMSNLSSIYNTISRQAESLGKPAAVYTLHDIKSVPLKKQTPGNLSHLPSCPINCEIFALPCFFLSGACCLSKEVPHEGAVPKTCQPSSTVFSPWLGISRANPDTFASQCYHNKRNPPVWKLRKLKCPTYLWSGGCQRESVTCVQPENLSQSTKFPPTQEETTSDLQAGSLNRWLLLPTMCRHKCFIGRAGENQISLPDPQLLYYRSADTPSFPTRGFPKHL